MENRILIVDDEPPNLTLVAAILKPLGCELVRAGNGQEALEALERQAFDLVVLDMMMPVMDGLEALRVLRSRAEWATLPVLILTAAFDREARLRGFEAGADEFLEKPIDRAMLLTRVRTLLRLREARELLVERARTLDALNEERRELMNLIVHDLKNPLSVIHTNLYFLSALLPESPAPMRDALQDATAATDRMKGLITDILNVERMDRAEIQIRRQEIDVASLIEEVARAHRREAELQNLQIMTEIGAGAGTLRADRDLIRRVIENLVENALRHTPANGSIELMIENDGEFAILISNTGTPVPEKLRPQLFNKFSRGEDQTRSRFGLGLYFCKRVAEAHGGSLGLVEREAWPVSFRFALPSGE